MPCGRALKAGRSGLAEPRDTGVRAPALPTLAELEGVENQAQRLGRACGGERAGVDLRGLCARFLTLSCAGAWTRTRLAATPKVRQSRRRRMIDRAAVQRGEVPRGDAGRRGGLAGDWARGHRAALGVLPFSFRWC